MTDESATTLSNTRLISGRWRAHRRARSGTAVAALAVVMLLLAGCTSKGAAVSSASVASSATPATTHSTATPTTTSAAPTASRPIPTGTVNDLKLNSAHHNVALDGENFRLKVDYFTTSDANDWGAIGSKDIHLLAYLNPAAGSTSPDVVIDEFDATYSLLAANSGLDNFVVAQMQDRAGAAIPGFLVTSKISYGSVFPTSGVSPALVQRWESLGGSMPIEEASLQRAGVYAVKISFTYLLLVRNTGDSGWHRRTVLDELTVPVKSVLPPKTAASSSAAPKPTPTG